MARTRTLEEMTSDVRIKADIRNALSRWPAATLYRLVNQGVAALRDLMIEVRGQLFFRKNGGQTLTLTTATRYALNADFYMLISVREEETGDLLRMWKPEDESWLREAGLGSDRPTHYQLQQDPSDALTYIELLPATRGGKTVKLEYIPTLTDLVVSPGANTLVGYQGWEDYPVWFAVREVAIADDEPDLKKTANEQLAELGSRIRKLAPRRDQFRPERVRNVRNPFGRRWP
jgi:hypothetical protein